MDDYCLFQYWNHILRHRLLKPPELFYLEKHQFKDGRMVVRGEKYVFLLILLYIRGKAAAESILLAALYII